MIDRNAKILILGASGLVGSALVRAHEKAEFEQLLSPPHADLDLTCQSDVRDYFAQNKPDYVYFAAAKVGGIAANDRLRADAIWQNLAIQNNVFEAAHQSAVKKLLFFGSSCIYPKNAPQPIKEEALLSGALEATNEPYAIAKIAGLKTAESFRRQYNAPFYTIMPCNLYGFNDRFDGENGHVIPALIARMKRAIEQGDSVFTCWGTGRPLREFLYDEDLARAAMLVMEKADDRFPYWLNVGSGHEVSIHDLVKMIARFLRFEGKIVFDPARPDGTMRKILDSQQIRALGWQPEIEFEAGLKLVVDSLCKRP
jgi:GDP-L-fucose synthase